MILSVIIPVYNEVKTINCGIGFCIIINPKNLNKITKYFEKDFKPYIIGKISKSLSSAKYKLLINKSKLFVLFN